MLFKKLRLYGFSDAAVKWVERYLTQRQFSLMFYGRYSENKSLSCGVPQGSCPGPLSSSIIVNDLPYTSDHSKMQMIQQYMRKEEI